MLWEFRLDVTFVWAAVVVFVEPWHAGPGGRGDRGLEGGRVLGVP